MLEQHDNQASGLLGLGCQPGPRMIAVVHHGDEQAELPFLWQLCLALVNFGYCVTVLDATIEESPNNPGLAQLLETTHWRDEDMHHTPAWTVLPAGKGLRNLCVEIADGSPKLHQLGRLFPADGVIILYCKVEPMIELIGARHIEPLLAVSPLRTSLMTSYIALKRLLITGKLQPTIVNMIQDQGTDSPVPTRVTLSGLSQCAKRFLRLEVTTLDIVEQCGETIPNGDIQRLALRLLERSLPLRAEYEQTDGFPRASHRDQFDFSARSH